jgi:hypothetical protein
MEIFCVKIGQKQSDKSGRVRFKIAKFNTIL